MLAASSLNLMLLEAYHFQQAVQQFVDADLGSTRKVSLVTQSGSKQEIIQIWGIEALKLIFFLMHHKLTLIQVCVLLFDQYYPGKWDVLHLIFLRRRKPLLENTWAHDETAVSKFNKWTSVTARVGRYLHLRHEHSDTSGSSPGRSKASYQELHRTKEIGKLHLVAKDKAKTGDEHAVKKK